MALDCIPVLLSRKYYVLGRFVGRHPLPFLIVPIILTFLCLLGTLRLDFTNDAEFLYTPINGRAKDERDFFQDTFPSDDDNFSPVSYTKLGGFLRVIIEDKRNRNILNERAIDALFALHDFILNVKEKDKGKEYRYGDICASFEGNCTYSEILTILANRVAGDTSDITYPFHVEPGYGTYNLITQLGGVKLRGDVIQSARSIQLSYYVRYKYSDDKDKGDKWLNEARDELDDYKDSRIKIEFQTSLTIDQELGRSVEETFPLFAIASKVLSTFAISTTLMADHVSLILYARFSIDLILAYSFVNSIEEQF